MRRLLTIAAVLCLTLAVVPADASVMEEIKTHNNNGKTVFVVLTDSKAQGLDTARRVAKAAQERVAKSEIVVLNRDDIANRAAVAQYRVAGAPVPLVLVVASNGLPVGAAKPMAPGASERLVGLVPSPAKAKYLKILSQRQVAMVVFSRRTMEEQSPLFEQITAFGRMPKIGTGTVLVNLDDNAEAAWIKQWKMDPKTIKRPLLIFVNPKGQVIGQLEGAPSAQKMQEMASKKADGCGCGNPKCKGGHNR